MAGLVTVNASAAAIGGAGAGAGSSRRVSDEEVLAVEAGVEPGASSDPILLTTDSFEEVEQELNGQEAGCSSHQTPNSPVKRVTTFEALEQAASVNSDEMVSSRLAPTQIES